MAEVFNVTKRSDRGRQANKRLRRTGAIPAILYGHGQESLSLSVAGGELASALRHSSKKVDLKGDVTESALIRAIQYCPFGIDILHLDLMRVSDTDTVEITITLELRGEAAGIKEGGIVNFGKHEIDINCPVKSIPEHLYVNIADLRLGKAIHASELTLPEGATLITDPHTVIVNCAAPHLEAEATPGAVIEPELIRKPKEDEKEEK